MSIALVAKKAGVSQATVSYVINNKPGVSEETIARVKQVIKELGYVPRPSRLRAAQDTDEYKLKSGNIGLAIPEGVMSQSQLNTRLFEAVHADLERRSLRLMPVRISADSNLQEALSNNNTLSDLDGLLLFYYVSLLDAAKLPSMPCVGVLGHPDPVVPLVCDHVEPDNIRVGVMAAKYLADKGHKRIVAINPSTKKHAAMDIRCGHFLAGADALNVKAGSYHVPIETACGDDSGTGIADQRPLAKWIDTYKKMDDKPTGIFVPSDSHLLIVFNAFRQAGIEPGRDADFVGCNNESMILRGMSPTPATIDIKPDVIARTAIDILLRRIGEANGSYTTTYVEPEIVAFN